MGNKKGNVGKYIKIGVAVISILLSAKDGGKQIKDAINDLKG